MVKPGRDFAMEAEPLGYIRDDAPEVLVGKPVARNGLVVLAMKPNSSTEALWLERLTRVVYPRGSREASGLV